MFKETSSCHAFTDTLTTLVTVIRHNIQTSTNVSTVLMTWTKVYGWKSLHIEEGLEHNSRRCSPAEQVSNMSRNNGSTSSPIHEKNTCKDIQPDQEQLTCLIHSLASTLTYTLLNLYQKPINLYQDSYNKMKTKRLSKWIQISNKGMSY